MAISDSFKLGKRTDTREVQGDGNLNGLLCEGYQCKAVRHNVPLVQQGQMHHWRVQTLTSSIFA